MPPSMLDLVNLMFACWFTFILLQAVADSRFAEGEEQEAVSLSEDVRAGATPPRPPPPPPHSSPLTPPSLPPRANPAPSSG
jgi:hypothetical protein